MYFFIGQILMVTCHLLLNSSTCFIPKHLIHVYMMFFTSWTYALFVFGTSLDASLTLFRFCHEWLNGNAKEYFNKTSTILKISNWALTTIYPCQLITFMVYWGLLHDFSNPMKWNYHTLANLSAHLFPVKKIFHSKLSICSYLNFFHP